MRVHIKAMKLGKAYKRCRPIKEASISIEQGKFYVIMGRSGSGKTTLLSLLGLLDNPTYGQLYIDGIEISGLKEKERALLRMKKFGFVFQRFYLNPKLTACENVMIPMYINPEYRNIDLKVKSIELLSGLGLAERWSYRANQLSGGEQQRVAIARALANNPDVIFADEPTGNLDVESENRIFEILKDLAAQGKSIVVVSHNNEVLKYADTVYWMNDGILEELQDEV